MEQEKPNPTNRFRNIMDIHKLTKEDKEEILKLNQDGYRDLFNWCEPYKRWVSENIYSCMTMEVEYILKKSYEDSEAPFSYEDLDLFDMDRAKESLLYNYEDNEDNEEEYKKYSNNEDTFNRKVKNKGDFEVFLNSLDKEELKEICNEFNLDGDQTEGEVYEWWAIGDELQYRLEQQGEIFLNNYWGRQGTGQSISLDSSVINAFLNLLKDNLY